MNFIVDQDSNLGFQSFAYLWFLYVSNSSLTTFNTCLGISPNFLAPRVATPIWCIALTCVGLVLPKSMLWLLRPSTFAAWALDLVNWPQMLDQDSGGYLEVLEPDSQPLSMLCFMGWQ